MTQLARFERWDPFEELSLLRNRVNRLLPRFNVEPEQELFTAEWAPAADVIETIDAIVIKAEVPGMTEKDITVQLENNLLTIRGERKIEKDMKEKDFRRIERAYGTFTRTFTLPNNVDFDKITATTTNGLLEIEVPKKEALKPKTIQIEAKKKLTAAA
jgi:HSP20 family protein